jgi:hypothetical protein
MASDELLTNDEQRILNEWARWPTTAQRVAPCSRMMLACAEGLRNRAVAKRLRMSSNSVCKWRERFRVRLTDEPRPGTPRKATDDQVMEVITRTLEGPPPVTQWTTRSMAEVAGLSKATISRILTDLRVANRTASPRSNCRPTRTFSRKCEISSAGISTRPITR